MYHKLKKDAGSLKVGDYIDVHKDQLEDLVKRNVVEEDGVEELPADREYKEPVEDNPQVSTTSDILVNTEAAEESKDEPKSEDEPKVNTTADILNPDEAKETKKK